MSNLKNMTDKILEDGRAEAVKIKEISDKTNDEIIKTRILDANEKKDKIIEEAKTEARMLASRRKSEVNLRVRDEKLMAKHQVLDKTFELAKNNLKNIDEDSYIIFLKGNLNKLNLKGSESLVVPEKFKYLVKNSGLNINISDEENVESGFIVRDGNIEINFSFDSLVDYMREGLEPEVAKILFEEKEWFHEE